VEQIAVGGVDLNGIKPSGQCASGRLPEGLDDTGELVWGQGMRHTVFIRKCNRAWGNDHGVARGAFASGMGQLDGGLGAKLVDQVNQASHTGDLAVFP